MPGMATDAQIAQLSTLPEREMVIQFMTLMIAHHQSAVEMANAILDRTDNEVVRHLAESIIKTQQGEINVMNEYLADIRRCPPRLTPAELRSPLRWQRLPQPLRAIMGMAGDGKLVSRFLRRLKPRAHKTKPSRADWWESFPIFPSVPCSVS